MAQGKLNRTPWTISVRKGLDGYINADTTYFVEGELGYTTDTKQLYVSDSGDQLRVPTSDAYGDVYIDRDLTIGGNSVIASSIDGYLELTNTALDRGMRFDTTTDSILTLTDEAGGSLALNLTGKVTIDGAADTNQLVVQAHSSQANTNPLILLEAYDGTDIGSLHTDSIFNIFLGINAGLVNNSGGGGTFNMFIGPNAGSWNTTGGHNCFIGSGAGQRNTTAITNVGVGTSALGFNNGSSNVAIGYAAGQGTIGQTATRNVFIGSGAGQRISSANDNVFIGTGSGTYNTTGDENVCVGTAAGAGPASPGATFSHNTYIGHRAGIFTTSGGHNVFLGYKIGDNLATGSDNIIIGYDLDASAVDISNELNIGGLITGNTSAKTLAIDGTLKATGYSINIVAKTTAYTLVATDDCVTCTTTFTVDLPVPAAGKIYYIKNAGSGVITVDADTTGSTTIDGSATITLEQYEAVQIIADSSEYHII